MLNFVDMHLTTSVHERHWTCKACPSCRKASLQIRFFPRLIVRECQVIVMLLILMLEQLAQIAKHSVARLATVGKVWSSGIAISVVLQHGSGDVRLHLSLGRSKLIDLIPRIILSSASSAVATLNMLDSVGTRTESTVSTNRTRNLFWAVHLHVHV